MLKQNLAEEDVIKNLKAKKERKVAAIISRSKAKKEKDNTSKNTALMQQK